MILRRWYAVYIVLVMSFLLTRLAAQEDYLDFGAALIDTAERLQLRDPVRAMEIAKSLLDANQFEGRMVDKVRALLICAGSMKLMGTTKEALLYSNQAYDLARKINVTEYRLRTAFSKATIFTHADTHDSSLYYYQEAIHLFQPEMDSFYLSESYCQMGEIFREIGNYEKAEEYVLKGYRLSKSNEYAKTFALTKVIDYYLMVQDSVYLKYLDTLALTSFFRKASHEVRMAHFGSFLGLNGMNPADREEKLRSLYTHGLQHSRAENFIGWGMMLSEEMTKNGKLDEAGALLKKLYGDAVNSGSGVQIANVLKSQFENARARGMPEDAIGFLDQYTIVRDELLSQENRIMLSELNVQFETAQKDHMIARQQLQLRQIQRNRIFLLVMMTLIGTIVGIVIVFFRQKARSAQRIAEQHRIIHLQDTERLVKEKQVAELKVSLESQEKERHRIARELHDGIGSMMSGISAYVEVLNEPGQSYPHMQELRDLVKETTSEVRRTSHELLPTGLLRHGIEPAIRDLCMNVLSKQGITTNLEIQGDMDQMPQEHQLLIFRILQELLHNIVKHAAASHVLVQLHSYDDEMTLVVEDDGRGFVISDESITGIGLGSIKSRVDLLGGFLDIASTPGDGTTVTINFPVHKANGQEASREF